MPGVNCSVYGCGSCRRTNGIGIFKVPLMAWWVARRIKKQKQKQNRLMDQDFRRQIKDDKIYTCEKHFDHEDTEICKYGFIDS